MSAHATWESEPEPAEVREELTTDDVFEVLGNRRRRYVFHYLKRHDERTVSLSELTDSVAAWEEDRPGGTVDQRKHNSVRTALRQSHLPMMADRGFVEYDRDRQTVRLASAATDLDVYLDVVGRGDIPWGLYYLGLAGLFGCLVVASILGIPPIGSLGSLAVAEAFLVTLSVSALIHTYYSYTEMQLGASDVPPDLRQK